MLRRVSRLLVKKVDYMAVARALAPNFTVQQTAAVALALQAKDMESEKEKLIQAKESEKLIQAKESEKEKLLQAKKSEKEKLLQAKKSEKEELMMELLPWQNRQAVEALAKKLGDRHGCTVLKADNTLNVSRTIHLLFAKLDGCENKKALRGAERIFKTLSQQLHRPPLRLSIDTPGIWTGLDDREAGFMQYVYQKCKNLKLI